jgi:hypothetical protein
MSDGKRLFAGQGYINPPFVEPPISPHLSTRFKRSICYMAMFYFSGFVVSKMQEAQLMRSASLLDKGIHVPSDRWVCLLTTLYKLEKIYMPYDECGGFWLCGLKSKYIPQMRRASSTVRRVQMCYWLACLSSRHFFKTFKKNRSVA